jgi:hypothetical protein
MSAAGDQHNIADEFFRLRAIQQKGVALDRFVGQSTAAGFLPDEPFVQHRDTPACARQPLRTNGSTGTATDNGNFNHAGQGCGSSPEI